MKEQTFLSKDKLYTNIIDAHIAHQFRLTLPVC